MKRTILLAAAVLTLAGCNTWTSIVHKIPLADRCLTDLEPWVNGQDRQNFAQCWDRVDLLNFYALSQGSQLVPYRLVAPLKLAGKKDPVDSASLCVAESPDKDDPKDPEKSKKLCITNTDFLDKTNIDGRWRFLLLEQSDVEIEKSELPPFDLLRSYLLRRTGLPPEWWEKKQPDGSSQQPGSSPELVHELTDLGKKDIERGWPVGFTVDRRTSGKRAWQGEWLGLTCAACHTAQLEYKEAKYRVSGGPAMIDIFRFLEDLRNSLVALQEAASKGDKEYRDYLDRYKARFKERDVDEKELLATLRTAIENRVSWHERNTPPVPAGFARLDAFGDIYNDVTDLLHGIPENRIKSNAPVSYPFLWDTSHHNRTQWNGVAPPIPLGRNVGQVLGVFGKVDFEVGWFDDTTTIDFYNVEALQNLVNRLRSPKWPETFGKIKPGLAAAGKQLFERHCQQCHVEQRRDEPLWYVKMAIVPADKIRTDPLMAENVNRRLAVMQEDKNKVEIVNNLVGDVASSTIVTMRLLTLLYEGFMNCVLHFWPWDCLLDHFEGYKGRPLDGIWATAPYLHNGSVPNLFYLLKPPHERPKAFCVGSREFDPKHVGFVMLTKEECDTKKLHWLDTSLPGNSNSGHHGHKYGGDLSDDEIWQLVEYMKDL